MKTLSSNQQTKAVLLLLWTNLPTFERPSANLVMIFFYNKSDKDPTKQFSDEITNKLNNMYDNGYIDENILKCLIPDSPKPGRLYLLPEIHKTNRPGRPIVSANGLPTGKSSAFVDFHPRQHVAALPSFIKDTLTTCKMWQL